ncbi:Transcriptional regulator [Streptococcus sp. DD12]|nr:Transcriptional regulator [Streptococcus sp. DD12]
MSVSELIDEGLQKIPDSYYEKKNRLIKFPTYGDSGRIAQKLQLIAEVHEEYDELLPEDELLTLDIFESVMNFSLLEKGPKTEEIFEDVFLQAQKKKKLSTNDLLVIHYYFLENHDKKYLDKKILEMLCRKLLNQEISADETHNITLIVVLMSCAAVYLMLEEFKTILPIANRLLQFVDEAQLQTYKPGALALKAKYYSRYLGDSERANRYYDKALSFARLLNDDALVRGIKQEKEKDGI